jgi:heat-inducible transcriptional repressor
MMEGLQAERDRDILRCLVDRHVSTASPVGSTSIARKSYLGVSPATIRNTMVELEEAGYISRPHPSAGGVPTDKGYRCYVDVLLRLKPISMADRQYIHQELQKDWKNVQEVLSHTAHILGMVCREVGIALAPRLYEAVFQRLELITVSERKILLVLMISSGLVRNIVAEVDSEIPSHILRETTRFVNERLSGLTLGAIKNHLDEHLSEASEANRRVIQLFIQYTNYLFDFQENEQMHMGGGAHIVSQPEFSTDPEKLSRLLEFLEHKQAVAQWLHQRHDANQVVVTIGNEHAQNEMRPCSVVTSCYKIGNVTGIIGVIGPTRMPYSRLISIVGYTARTLNTMLV